jgi:hypothetical protein
MEAPAAAAAAAVGVESTARCVASLRNQQYPQLLATLISESERLSHTLRGKVQLYDQLLESAEFQ